MFFPLHLLLTLMSVVAQRRTHLREHRRKHPDDGYSTEAVIATALLAALAIGAIAAITVKVMARANNLDVGHD